MREGGEERKWERLMTADVKIYNVDECREGKAKHEDGAASIVSRTMDTIWNIN